MTDSGEKKTSAAKVAAQHALGGLIALVLMVALYEGYSRLDTDDPTAVRYRMWKCQVLLALSESNVADIDQRLKDLEVERWRLADECGAADQRVQARYEAAAKEPAELTPLAEDIRQRDALDVRSDEVERLWWDLGFRRDAELRRQRELKLDLARHQAKLTAP